MAWFELTMSGFIINLALLTPGVTRLDPEGSAGELELPEEGWPAPIQGRLAVDKSGEMVTVRGQIEAVARLECARCLSEFDQRVEAELTVVADRGGEARGLERDLERDHYMKFHDGRQLDLREEVRESLLLEIPMTPHCREECRGLCPRCGANLNEGPCACASQESRAQ